MKIIDDTVELSQTEWEIIGVKRIRGYLKRIFPNRRFEFNLEVDR